MYYYRKSKIESLSEWLEIATKGLAQAGKQRIAQEIEAHYADAVEARLSQGKPGPVARANALAELGDPVAAGKRFRKKHFTEKELTWLAHAQKMAGNRGVLAVHYIGSAAYYLIVVVCFDSFAKKSTFTLYMFVAALILAGVILPTISFLIARGRLFRGSPSVFSLMQLLDMASYAVLIAFFVTNPVAFVVFCFIWKNPWLRIWNKVRKTGENGNGAPTPA